MNRLGGESGYSLIEALVVMVIMTTVMGAITSLFVAGADSELDMNRRFQAQQTARLALDKIRREIHCANVAVTSPTTGAATSVKLTLPSQCKAGTGDISWCTVSVSTNRFALYRKLGATCNATGTKWADYLTSGSLFEYAPQRTTSLARLQVKFPVDMNLRDSQPAYSLCDQIVLRNSDRTGTSSITLSGC